MLTTVPIATTASYLPLFAMAFARIGSSKLPGTQATYFTAQKTLLSEILWCRDLGSRLRMKGHTDLDIFSL